MTDQSGVQLDANATASSTVPKPAAISWPYPADRRLDQLVELANRAGANTRRHELAAALVAAASVDGDELLRLVVAWRRCAVRDVVINVPSSAQSVELPRYPPGRRRASS